MDAHRCCAFQQSRQTVQLCWELATIFLSQTKPACFELFFIQFYSAGPHTEHHWRCCWEALDEEEDAATSVSAASPWHEWRFILCHAIFFLETTSATVWPTTKILKKTSLFNLIRSRDLASMEQNWAMNGCELWSDDDNISTSWFGWGPGTFPSFVLTSSTCVHKQFDHSPTMPLSLMQTFNMMKLSFNALQIASIPSSDCGTLWHVNGNFSSSFFGS